MNEIINQAIKDILTLEVFPLDKKKKLLATLLNTVYLEGKCAGIKEIARELKTD